MYTGNIFTQLNHDNNNDWKENFKWNHWCISVSGNLEPWPVCQRMVTQRHLVLSFKIYFQVNEGSFEFGAVTLSQPLLGGWVALWSRFLQHFQHWSPSTSISISIFTTFTIITIFTTPSLPLHGGCRLTPLLQRLCIPLCNSFCWQPWFACMSQSFETFG